MVIPQLIENINIGSERVEQIVKALRYFASSEDEDLDYIDLNETIDLACLIFESKLNNKIVINKNLTLGLKPLKCYSGLIKQLITNLLANAIDAISDKGEIVIKTWIERDRVDLDNFTQTDFFKISIRDNGIGIEKENIDKIFLPFFTTKEAGKGTGMGLAICHTIIEKHLGKIIVKSEFNQGTEFIILIPGNL